MKVGIDSLPLMAGIRKPSAVGLLERAVELGAEGVHFGTIDTFPGRDEGSVRQVARAAQSLGLYVEVGMGTCNPSSNCRAPGEVGRDPRATLGEMIQIARWAGSPVVRTVIGWLEERRMGSPSWPEQIGEVVAILSEVAPEAEDAGVVICIEDHMDATAGEVLSVIERVDSPAVGACLDTANPLMLCEDPLEAAHILAPYVHCTHIKDAALAGTIERPRFVSAPLGKGVVDLAAIVKVLETDSPCQTLSIEDHGGVFELYAPELDETLRDVFDRNHDKLTGWLERGNRQLAEGNIRELPEMFDETAQRELASRCSANLAVLNRLVDEGDAS